MKPPTKHPTAPPPTKRPTQFDHSVETEGINKNYNQAKSACNSIKQSASNGLHPNPMVLCSPKQLRHRASTCEYRTEPVWTNVKCRTQYDLDEAMRTKKEACSVSKAPEFKLVEEE